MTVYITTTIPYVNARPHLGFALELVQADVLARHYRSSQHVRLQTGTDDNSLKNVLAAQAAGVGVQDFVDANADAFVALAGPLSLSVDDVIRTSSDPRHAPGVEALWRACSAAGDIYRKHYSGLYCVGCEQFYSAGELDDGVCPDHGTPPDLVEEENWFFRLSRYGQRLHDEIASGRLRVEPRARRNEVLGFIAGGLEDFSISRSTARARGWGIPVPGDAGQVIYVWWDALGNYLTALGYGSGEENLSRWWTGAGRRIHLLGKGVLRFHAVYWPAMLLSAGLPLPTDIYVHDYLTVDGRRISKSGGVTVDPASLAAEYGTDAVRWWLLREVPRTGDTDFTRERLVARANGELVNGIGNLVNRTVAMIGKYRHGTVQRAAAGLDPALLSTALLNTADLDPAVYGSLALPESRPLAAACRRAPDRIAAALDEADFRRATATVWEIAEEANRFISQTTPWRLARAEQDGDRRAAVLLDQVLATALAACRELARQLEPFLPDAAARIAVQCAAGAGGSLPPPAPVFARLA
jgi:methionyl-tRNA synthetase